MRLPAEEALQSLLECLTCPPYTPTQHLEKEQALAKQFAEILHFTLRFDELKVSNTLYCTQCNIMSGALVWNNMFLQQWWLNVSACFLVFCQMRIPAIQNDFSYYRRTISRNRINNMNVSCPENENINSDLYSWQSNHTRNDDRVQKHWKWNTCWTVQVTFVTQLMLSAVCKTKSVNNELLYADTSTLYSWILRVK